MPDLQRRTRLAWTLSHDPDMDDQDAVSFISSGSQITMQLLLDAWHRIGDPEELTVHVEPAPS